MKISYKGDYAIKTVIALASIYIEDSSRLVKIDEISKAQDIPKKFLEQILLQLKNAGIVKSERGASGGYALKKNPAEIKLGEIVRLIDGTTAPIACVSCTDYKACEFEGKCALKPVWQQVREAVNSVVDNITVKELAERQSEIDKSLSGTMRVKVMGGLYI